MLNYLKQAQKAGVIILLVFHQPRSLVLKRIQNVILMGPQANILYSGPISQAERYFSQFAITNRHEYSDSDYLLDVVCVVFSFSVYLVLLFSFSPSLSSLISHLLLFSLSQHHSHTHSTHPLQVSSANEIQMDNMISAYRNREEYLPLPPLNPSNKLLLLNIRHIRRESVANMKKAQSFSFIRINDATTNPTEPQFKAFVPRRVSSSLLLPKPRFSPNLEVIEDARNLSPTQSSVPQVGSFSLRKEPKPLPSDDSSSSLYTVYTGKGDIPMLSPNRHSFTRTSPAASFQSRCSEQSMTSRAPESDWHVPSRVRLVILVRRIIRCIQRDHNYFSFHLLSSLVVGVSVGLSFLQLPGDLDGLNARLVVLRLSVFFFFLQGISGRLWYRKDNEVFIRDARCGYISSVEYFGVMTLLDRVLLRCIPSIVYVRGGRAFH